MTCTKTRILNLELFNFMYAYFRPICLLHFHCQFHCRCTHRDIFNDALMPLFSRLPSSTLNICIEEIFCLSVGNSFLHRSLFGMSVFKGICGYDDALLHIYINIIIQMFFFCQWKNGNFVSL